MKSLLFAFVIFGCASQNTDWDSGSRARSSYQEERQEQQVEDVRNQQPSAGEAGANQGQPF